MSSVRIKEESPPTPIRPTSSDLADDESDEIVREMDVFLSPELCTQIYLLQFPLQHTDVGTFTEARIKPRHGLMEIEQPLPTLPNRHYSSNETNFNFVQTRTFTSHTIPIDTHMCLAKLKEQENGQTALHMVPLQHISQMRPQLNSAPSMDEDENIDLDKMDEDIKPEKKPLLFKRQESERAANARLHSYAHKKASEGAEEWQMLQVCDNDTMEYQKAMDAVPCSNPQSYVMADKDDSRTSYIGSLNYMKVSKSEPGQGYVDGNDIRSVVARLTILLRNGWPIPFNVLRAQLTATTSISDEMIFRALSICAVMVRGNYCLHSQFVALPRPLQHVRTFLLLLIQTRAIIRRKKLEAVYEDHGVLSKDKLQVLLNQVAKKTPNGWECRVEDDLAFVASHPDQSEKNLGYWEKQTQLNATLLQKYDEAEG